MEEKHESQQSGGYTPRPAWQVWAARIGLVLFIGLVILSYILLANGALL